MGNLSADGTPISYALSSTQLTAPYQFPLNNPQVFPVDDFNRSFPGNSLDSSNVLYTQCWNDTNSPVNLQDQACLSRLVLLPKQACYIVWQLGHAQKLHAGANRLYTALESRVSAFWMHRFPLLCVPPKGSVVCPSIPSLSAS